MAELGLFLCFPRYGVNMGGDLSCALSVSHAHKYLASVLQPSWLGGTEQLVSCCCWLELIGIAIESGASVYILLYYSQTCAGNKHGEEEGEEFESAEF